MKFILNKIFNLILRILIKLNLITKNDKAAYLRNKLIVKNDFINHHSKLDFFEQCEDRKKGELFIKEIKKKKINTLKVYNCLICKKKHFKKVAEDNMGNVTGICKNCGHVQIYKRFSDKFFDFFYSDKNDYYHAICMPKINIEKEFNNLSNNLGMQFVKMFKSFHVKKSSQILELGCGSGGILFSLYRNGYKNISGMDINKNEIDYGKKFIKNLYVKNIYKIQKKDLKNKNIIILSNVLEHLTKPVEFMQLISNCMTNQLLYIDIPILDLSHIYDNANLKKFFHIAHVSYFSLMSFENAAYLSGFEIKNIIPKYASATFILKKSNKKKIKKIINSYNLSLFSINNANIINTN